LKGKHIKLATFKVNVILDSGKFYNIEPLVLITAKSLIPTALRLIIWSFWTDYLQLLPLHQLHNGFGQKTFHMFSIEISPLPNDHYLYNRYKSLQPSHGKLALFCKASRTKPLLQ